MPSRIVDKMSDQALLMRLLACWNAYQNGADSYPFELTVGADYLQAATSITVGTEVLSEADVAFINGILATVDEINLLQGLTANAAELNVLDGISVNAAVHTAHHELLANVTSNAAELNILDGVTANTAELNILDGVTANTAELNILDGVTANTAELNVLDGVTAGTVTASKAVVVDANKDAGFFRNLGAELLQAGWSGKAGEIAVYPSTVSTGAFFVTCSDQAADTSVTLNIGQMGQQTSIAMPDPGIPSANVVLSTSALLPAEVDVLDGVTAGTVTASKAVVVDANKDVTGFRYVYADAVQLGRIGDGGAAGLVVVLDGLNPGSYLSLDYGDFFLIEGITAGTVTASKAVVVDADKRVDTLVIGTLNLGTGAGTAVTSNAAELNILDGVTSNAAELNILDGVTASAAEINVLAGITAAITVGTHNSHHSFISAITANAAELNIMDGVTANTAELNILDGVTANAAELNKLDGCTASTGELNVLDGFSHTAEELNTAVREAKDLAIPQYDLEFATLTNISWTSTSQYLWAYSGNATTPNTSSVNYRIDMYDLRDNFNDLSDKVDALIDELLQAGVIDDTL